MGLESIIKKIGYPEGDITVEIDCDENIDMVFRNRKFREFLKLKKNGDDSYLVSAYEHNLIDDSSYSDYLKFAYSYPCVIVSQHGYISDTLESMGVNNYKQVGDILKEYHDSNKYSTFVPNPLLNNEEQTYNDDEDVLDYIKACEKFLNGKDINNVCQEPEKGMHSFIFTLNSAVRLLRITYEIQENKLLNNPSEDLSYEAEGGIEDIFCSDN